MIDTVLLVLLALASAAGAGVFIFTNVIYEKPLLSDAIEKALLLKDAADKTFIPSIEMKKKIINLAGRRGRLRFLDMKISLVPFKKQQRDANDKVEEKRAEISDIIIDISSRMSPGELNTISGKILLENRLKVKMNEILGKKYIKKILFTRFVIQ